MQWPGQGLTIGLRSGEFLEEGKTAACSSGGPSDGLCLVRAKTVEDDYLDQP
jgi:hypothetical protein